LYALSNQVAADVQGQSIAAVRDANGDLRAFYKVCEHRGPARVQGEGRVRLLDFP